MDLLQLAILALAAAVVAGLFGFYEPTGTMTSVSVPQVLFLLLLVLAGFLFLFSLRGILLP